jgi:AcrR family transcriptional regulator
MTTNSFIRARSESQRSERRDAIINGAADMLDEVRVSELSLNELARHVGLAKSNVLRYFQTREAILLELYVREYSSWLDALEHRLDGSHDIEVVARAIAETAAERPRFCELCSASASVLEHNVSGDAAAGYKRESIGQAERLASMVGVGSDLRDYGALVGVAGVNLAIAGVWAIGRPSPGMSRAYRDNPDLRPLQIEFTTAVRELVATLLTGLAHRNPRV